MYWFLNHSVLEYLKGDDMYKEHKEILDSTKFLDPKISKKGKLDLASVALHPEMITLLAEVAELSREKGYKPLNWLEQDSKVTVMYCLNASERHKQKAKLGIDFNNEETTLTGQPTKISPMHLAQSAYNDLMAALIILKNSKNDDRVFNNGQLKNDL